MAGAAGPLQPGLILTASARRTMEHQRDHTICEHAARIIQRDTLLAPVWHTTGRTDRAGDYAAGLIHRFTGLQLRQAHIPGHESGAIGFNRIEQR
jgi:hypothetical protein